MQRMREVSIGLGFPVISLVAVYGTEKLTNLTAFAFEEVPMDPEFASKIDEVYGAGAKYLVRKNARTEGTDKLKHVTEEM